MDQRTNELYSGLDLFQSNDNLYKDKESLKRYLDEGINAILNEYVPEHHHYKESDNILDNPSLNQLGNIEIQLLRRRIDEVRMKLNDNVQRYSQELTEIREIYENKLSKIRRETTNIYQTKIERAMSIKPKATVSEIETDMKKELNQRLLRELEEERQKLYKELKSKMYNKIGINETIDKQKDLLRKQIINEEENKIREKIEKELKHDYSDLRVEEEKDKILDEITKAISKEYEDNYQREVDKLQAQTERELNENKEIIKREVEDRLSIHIRKIDLEQEGNYTKNCEELKSICLQYFNIVFNRELREKKEKEKCANLNKELQESIKNELQEALPIVITKEIKDKYEKSLKKELDCIKYPNFRRE